MTLPAGLPSTTLSDQCIAVDLSLKSWDFTRPRQSVIRLARDCQGRDRRDAPEHTDDNRKWGCKHLDEATPTTRQCQHYGNRGDDRTETTPQPDPSVA